MSILGVSLVWGLSGFLVIATLLPFTKLPHGAVQAFAFPREQFLLLAVVCACALPVIRPDMLGWAGAGVMAVVAIIQSVFIVKFTPFWAHQSVKADAALLGRKDTHLTVLAANVKMSNRAYDRLIALIETRNPDVVMAIEVDARWVAALKAALKDRYAHWIDVPRDNGYGMCVMSHLPVSETQVRDLVTQDVPSVRTRVTLRSGQDVRLYVVHPEPPVLSHDTIGRDSEIALIGLEAADDALPVIVTGDLNDVAWSTTTRRFQRLSGLLDPRVGRGFYNTFSATMPLMRWPLDHLFHSPQFRLVQMARMPKIGSDHFAMWFALALADEDAVHSDPGTSDTEEVAETKTMIRKEQRRARGPIGADWEKD